MALLELKVRDVLYARTDRRTLEKVVGPVSLEVRTGEFVSIVGPAACGKTTLVKMIAGILPAAEGEIRILKSRERARPGDLGLVLQLPALLPWRTAMQNILLPAELTGLDLEQSRNRARLLMAWFGLSGWERKWPHELPPGTSRAVSICRALVHNPSLLLMDEPFRNLDALATEQVLDGFQRLWSQNRPATVLCTCNMHEAVLLSDRVAVMSPRPGRILDILPIDLPRPRRLDKATAPRIAEHCDRIRTLFRAQGVLP